MLEERGELFTLLKLSWWRRNENACPSLLSFLDSKSLGDPNGLPLFVIKSTELI